MKFSRFFNIKCLCLTLAAACLLAAGPALAAEADGPGEYVQIGPTLVSLYAPPAMVRIDQINKKYDDKLREYLPGYNGLVAIYAEAASWAEFKKAVDEGRKASLEFYAYAATIPKLGSAPMMTSDVFQMLREAIAGDTDNYNVLENGPRDIIYKEKFSDETLAHIQGLDYNPKAAEGGQAGPLPRNPEDHVVFNMLINNRQMLFYVCADKSRADEVMPFMRRWRQLYLDGTTADTVFEDDSFDNKKEVPTFDSFGNIPAAE